MMKVHDLLIILQHEVQKSLDFIDETKGLKDPSIPAVHISLETVEIELPLTFTEVDAKWDPKEMKGNPAAVKRLEIPYIPELVAERGQIPRRELNGKAIETRIIGPVDKLDERTQKEMVGRIKVVLKPILK